MEKNKYLYHIYHIPGKKIGITCDINKRVTQQQGYQIGEYEVLDSSYDENYISQRELELQLIYGYKQDEMPYKDLTELLQTLNTKNQMKLNVTDQTVTFPCPVNKLKGNLLDNLGMEIKTPLGRYILDENIATWIVNNSVTSMFNPVRSYVYNKALDTYVKSLKNTTATAKKAFNYSITSMLDNSTYDSLLDQIASYKEEKKAQTYSSTIFDKIRAWADERGIYDSGDTKTQFIKLQEEAGELARAILKNDKAEFVDAIGDMVVVLTNLAALGGHDIEECIASAFDVIESRKGKMVNGTFVKETL